jgi:folate-dependent tRNA-U54 methylase TrmFO/GidA
MFPVGLQFQRFKPVRKIPMRLENLSQEERKGHLYKIVGLNYTCTKPLSKKKEKTKKNKTSKKTKGKS